MSPHPQHDALVSVIVAAELSGVSVLRVMTLLASKVIRAVEIQGRRFVSLKEVERSIGEEGERGHSA